MKLTKEFIKNEIKRLLSEIQQDQDWPPEGTPAAVSPPAAATETGAIAATDCKKCKTDADCKKGDYEGHIVGYTSTQTQAGAVPLADTATQTGLTEAAEQKWDCVEGCCVPKTAAKPARPTPGMPDPWYRCYDKLLKSNPEIMKTFASAFSLMGGAEGARSACNDNKQCYDAVLEACKQATAAPEQCVDKTLVPPPRPCSDVAGGNYEFKGWVVSPTTGDQVQKCCKGAEKPAKPLPKPKPKPRRGGWGCGRRWISISRSLKGIRVCVLIPSKARRIQGGNVYADPNMPDKRVDRAWDTDPTSYDSQTFEKHVFETINPMLTHVGYEMREEGGFSYETIAGRNVFVGFYDLNPAHRRDREAKREARKVTRRITRDRKNIWYDIYKKTNSELVKDATTSTEMDVMADLDLGGFDV